MTDKQKIQMVQLKAKGYGYRKIASELNLSENTVKSFLKRNTDTCLNCGSNVVGKKYCSDKCRMIWWRNHPHRTTSMMECKCKVCGKVFYAYPSRVSNGKDAMLHSLSAQVEYYHHLITSHPDWKFCGVYADEAITGTKENREEFQRMIEECRKGNIQLILTKSISRFARNTVTLLETVRELRNLSIGVIFEEQNINSLSADGELMLTILASYAQEESYSASENQKWRIRKNFEAGKIGTVRLLGYKRTTDGSLEIIPEEAEIVRWMFRAALSGIGGQKIANLLNEQGIRTVTGNVWNRKAVQTILKNEKYAGNMLLQKSYRENHITKKKILNQGELPKYFVAESHPAIIDIDTFTIVENLLKSRKNAFSTTKSTATIYPFSGKIHCACCGKAYRRKTTQTGVVWICSTYNSRGKKYCPTAKQIPESTFIATCCDVLKTSDFDVENFNEQIESILVPAPNTLIFRFRDGHEETVEWKDRSRSESWTAEMKQATSERSKQWHEQSPKYHKN